MQKLISSLIFPLALLKFSLVYSGGGDDKGIIHSPFSPLCLQSSHFTQNYCCASHWVE